MLHTSLFLLLEWIYLWFYWLFERQFYFHVLDYLTIVCVFTYVCKHSLFLFLISWASFGFLFLMCQYECFLYPLYSSGVMVVLNSFVLLALFRGKLHNLRIKFYVLLGVCCWFLAYVCFCVALPIGYIYVQVC